MPWTTQVGMVASELSRVQGLLAQGGGPEIAGCLDRARELMGVLESTPTAPLPAALVLKEVAYQLSNSEVAMSGDNARDLYQRLMSLRAQGS